MLAAIDLHGVDAAAPATSTDRPRKLARSIGLLAGAGTYAVAKSVASGGHVTLLNAEFLLIGLLPFLVAALARPPMASPMRAVPKVWVAALMAFIVLTSTGIFEQLRVTVLASNGLDTLPVYIATCSVTAVAVGLAATWTVSRLAAPRSTTWTAASVAQLFSASVLMFAVLVFLIPV